MNTGRHKATRQTTLPGEALGERPGPWSVLFKVLSAALSGGLVVLLFAAIIPKLGDFGGVAESLSSMRAGIVLLMLVIALVIRVLLAEAYLLLTPGISLFKSLIAREASSAVSNVIPGPSGTAAQFVILHSWGVSPERYARATVAIGTSTNALIFAAPGAFFVVWVLLGMPASVGGEHEWAFGLGAAAVSVLTITVIGAVGKSVALARRVGSIGQACANPVRRVFGKAPVTTWPDQCVALRADLIEELKDHGLGLIACVLGGYLLNGLLLVLCIWECGVSHDQLPMSLGLLLYSVGRLSTVVSITPGGVGVVEIAYTAVYVAVLGEGAHNAVLAGVLVYRAFTYFLPIVTGAISYVIWRIMRHREKKRELVAAEDVGTVPT